MSLLLSIDTAGRQCGVALADGPSVLGSKVIDEPRVHASGLLPLIEELLKEEGHSINDLAAIAVSSGPGSFTGLRIGVSSAKGLAFGRSIPLIGIPTFEAMAAANAVHFDSGALLVTVAPSRRDEIYVQGWGKDDGGLAARGDPQSVATRQLFDFAASLSSYGPAVWIGESASEACLSAGTGTSISEPERVRAILGIAALGWERFEQGTFVDIAAFEPAYLKEFVAKRGASPFDKLSRMSRS